MRMGRATNRPFDGLDERRLFQFCAEIAQILSVNALDMFYGQATAEGKADILEIFSDRTKRLNRRRQSLLVTTLMMNRGRSPVSRRKTAVLMQINSWDFSALDHEQDHLEVCFLHIMDESGAIDEFKIEAGKLKAFVSKIRTGYTDTSYHNFWHAFDVVHKCRLLMLMGTPRARRPFLRAPPHTNDLVGMSCMRAVRWVLAMSVGVSLLYLLCIVLYYCIALHVRVQEFLDRFDQLSLLVAAIGHDVNHPGHNNSFEENTMSSWAVRYNGKSILENHHAATTWQAAIDTPTCITAHMDEEQKRTFRKSLIESILATDMVHHGKVTAQLKQLDPSEPFTKGNPDHKELLMKLCLHSADLSNPLASTFEVAKRWLVTLLICKHAPLCASIAIPLGASFLGNSFDMLAPLPPLPPQGAFCLHGIRHAGQKGESGGPRTSPIYGEHILHAGRGQAAVYFHRFRHQAVFLSACCGPPRTQLAIAAHDSTSCKMASAGGRR